MISARLIIEQMAFRGRFNTRSYEKYFYQEYKIQNESITIRAQLSTIVIETVLKYLQLQILRKQTTLSDKAYLSFAQTTQILGYSAIGGSETSGIFKSKHDLKRGVSKNLEFGFALERPSLLIEGAIFYVWDK